MEEGKGRDRERVREREGLLCVYENDERVMCMRL